MNARRAAPVVLVTASLATVSLPAFLVSALSGVLGDEIGLTESSLGLAVAVFFFMFAVASLPAGAFADRFGGWAGVRAGLLITVVGSLGIGATANNATVLLVWMAFAGLAIAFVDTGGARQIVHSLRQRRHGLALGIKEAGVPAASLLAGASLPLLGELVGWRRAYLLVAVVAGILVAVTTWQHRNQAHISRSADGVDTGQSALAEAAVAHAEGLTAGPEASVMAPKTSRRVEHSGGQPERHYVGELIMLATVAAFGVAAAMASAAFMVPSAIGRGIDDATAGMLLVIGSAAGIAIRVVVGGFSDRWARSAVPMVAAALFLGALGIWGLTSSNLAVLTVSGLFALGSGWGWTGLVFLIATRIAPTKPAFAAGAVLVGLGTGGAGGPLVFGFLAEAVGFDLSWQLAASAMGFAGVLALVLAVFQRRNETKTAP